MGKHSAMGLEQKSGLRMSVLSPPGGRSVPRLAACRRMRCDPVIAQGLWKAPALKFKVTVGALCSVDCKRLLVAT